MLIHIRRHHNGLGQPVLNKAGGSQPQCPFGVQHDATNYGNSGFTHDPHYDFIENNLKHIKRFKEIMDFMRTSIKPESISYRSSTYYHYNRNPFPQSDLLSDNLRKGYARDTLDGHCQPMHPTWNLREGDNRTSSDSSNRLINNASTAKFKNLTTYEDLRMGLSIDYPLDWSWHDLEGTTGFCLLVPPLTSGTTRGKMDFVTIDCPEGFSVIQFASNYGQAFKELRGFTLIGSKPIALSKRVPYPFHLLYFVFEDENEESLLSIVGLFQKGKRVVIVTCQASCEMRGLILPDMIRVFRSISLL